VRRLIVDKRPDWERKVTSQGLLYHTAGGIPYWDEGACYAFTPGQVDRVERVTAELWEMCLAAAQHVIEHNRYAELGVPPAAIPLVEASWEAEPPAVYSRFDFSWDGYDEPKLLELNADTPTSLLECAAIQWLWLEDVFPGFDQFNSLEPKLVAKWKELIGGKYLYPGAVHFAHDGSVEDRMTVGYMMKVALDAANELGVRLDAVELRMDQIGWNAYRRRFEDLSDQPIVNVFKLYPWETMVSQTFGEHLQATSRQMHWIEPAWKVLLTNKGLLAVLWEMFPGHPNLPPAYLGDARGMRDYARKPCYSREGANVQLVRGGCVLEKSGGTWGSGTHVYQGLALLPSFDGQHPVVGSWVVDGDPAGVGIRESGGFITDDVSRFVPHFIDETE
jgi:glutathionylspermidine synthase